MAEQKQHIKDLIKRYWAHTAKAHEEASAAASILRLLADEVDEQNICSSHECRNEAVNNDGGPTNGKSGGRNEDRERTSGKGREHA